MSNWYDNNTKQSARGWLWNRIDERLPREKTFRRAARIYCLIGTTTAELQQATKRGFSPYNVIGIDTKKEAVELWRRNGGLAIQSPLDLVIQTSKARPAAVICDFCAGINESTFNTFWLSFMHLSCPGVIALNLMRGRDADIDKVRTEEIQGVIDILQLDKRNRGHLIYAKMIFDSYICEPSIQAEFGSTKSGFLRFEKSIRNVLKPDFYTYKSANKINYFDQVVLSLPSEASQFTKPKPLDSDTVEILNERRKPNDIIKTKRRMAALEAVRTMQIRKNGGKLYREELV